MGNIENYNDLSFENQILLLFSKSSMIQEEVELFTKLIGQHMNWSYVLGQLYFHKIPGIAWRNISKYILEQGNIKCAYSKLYSTLQQTYLSNIARAKEQFELSIPLLSQLEREGINYALLKGIVLSNSIYNDYGCREFNDLDILIDRASIKEVSQILNKLGYVQGTIDFRTNKVISSERKEIALWSMVSHEVYPFIKQFDMPLSKYHKADIQFSIDLLTSTRTDEEVSVFLKRSQTVSIMGHKLSTLSWADFLIFLCIHFYKEAINYDEVIKYKDLLLYKSCDIHNMVNNHNLNIDWYQLIDTVKTFNIEKSIYYSLYYVSQLYGNFIPVFVLEALKPNNLDYLNKVTFYEKDHGLFTWTDTIVNRFFNPMRVSELIDLNLKKT
ncbi:nucleotidyltransferase family protein [Paenibacillus paeoniae]|uniref:Nucleotidyltransferase family protein n=1 Tax=Paenibacillus paeoniae TaxID=2292705 RepID=A0A371P6N3_9BACL|nr:nucleotidyltransferase family protein [Paenibacillus paeoniae]REK71607.1 hypothetical protein DX130_21715 [Paenibacillus paeoniae]